MRANKGDRHEVALVLNIDVAAQQLARPCGFMVAFSQSIPAKIAFEMSPKCILGLVFLHSASPTHFLETEHYEKYVTRRPSRWQKVVPASMG
jgi:hypothetical protein